MFFRRKRNESIFRDPKEGVLNAFKYLIFLSLAIGVVVFFMSQKTVLGVARMNSVKHEMARLARIENGITSWSNYDTIIDGIEQHIKGIRYPSQSTLKEDFIKDLESVGLTVVEMDVRNIGQGLVEVSVSGFVNQTELLAMLEGMGRTQKVLYVKAMTIHPRQDVGSYLANYSQKKITDAALRELEGIAGQEFVLSVNLEITTAVE